MTRLKEELQGELRHGSRNQPVEQVCANDVEDADNQDAHDGGFNEEIPVR